MCISTLLFVDDGDEITFGVAFDIDAHYEAFRLYSAYGGQEAIPRIVFPVVESQTAKVRYGDGRQESYDLVYGQIPIPSLPYR